MHYEICRRESTSRVVGTIVSNLQKKDPKVNRGKIICLRAKQELKTRWAHSLTLFTCHHLPKA